MRLAYLLRFAAPAVLVAALAGCSSPLSRVDVNDNSTFTPSGRVSVDLSRGQEPPSQPHSGHAIEAGYTKTSGDGTQALSAGDSPVIFNGQTFSAPTQIKYDFDFGLGEIQYRWRHFFGSSRAVGVEALAGLAHIRFKLAASSPGQQTSQTFSGGGVSLGAGFIWNFLPTTSLQTRLTGFAASEVSGSRLELFVAQAIGSNAAVRAGYTWWQVKSEPSGSDVEANFRGPALSFSLAF